LQRAERRQKRGEYRYDKTKRKQRICRLRTARKRQERKLGRRRGGKRATDKQHHSGYKHTRKSACREYLLFCHSRLPYKYAGGQKQIHRNVCQTKRKARPDERTCGQRRKYACQRDHDYYKRNDGNVRGKQSAVSAAKHKYARNTGKRSERKREAREFFPRRIHARRHCRKHYKGIEYGYAVHCRAQSAEHHRMHFGYVGRAELAPYRKENSGKSEHKSAHHDGDYYGRTATEKRGDLLTARITRADHRPDAYHCHGKNFFHDIVYATGVHLRIPPAASAYRMIRL